jgi:hypothetical protein
LWRKNDAWAAPSNRAQQTSPTHEKKEISVLYTLAVILIVLWLLGLVSSFTMGGFIHILLVVAVVVILVQLITGRRAI